MSGCNIVIDIKNIVIASHKTYHLLVAGNDATMHKKLSRQLNVLSVEIVFAKSPEMLYNYLQNPGMFDAVLVDNDETDVSCLNKIKNNIEEFNNQPLLILTSRFRTSSMALALQSGFDEFLAKPVGLTQILTLIKKQNTNQ